MNSGRLSRCQNRCCNRRSVDRPTWPIRLSIVHDAWITINQLSFAYLYWWWRDRHLLVSLLFLSQTAQAIEHENAIVSSKNFDKLYPIVHDAWITINQLSFAYLYWWWRYRHLLQTRSPYNMVFRLGQNATDINYTPCGCKTDINSALKYVLLDLCFIYWCFHNCGSISCTQLIAVHLVLHFGYFIFHVS